MINKETLGRRKGVAPQRNQRLAGSLDIHPGDKKERATGQMALSRERGKQMQMQTYPGMAPAVKRNQQAQP